MSNPLMIAAVTATMRKVINDYLSAITPGIGVTTLPLDKAREGRNDNQVNVYLYHTAMNAGWRNQDQPNRVKPGEIGFPPLALNLYYLVTAYGEGNDEVRSHGLLGSAMSILHDTPVLDPADIRTALPTPLTPDDQIERVRVTHEPLSVEEISKLWAAFQTNYRISAAYQASVILIDSARAGRAALPVIRRGEDDQGVTTLTAFPLLTSVETLQARIGGAINGDTLIIRGTGFQADNLALRLIHPRLTTPHIILNPIIVSETEIRFVIPPDSGVNNWPAGTYNLSAIIAQPGSPNILHTSNELPVSIMPVVTSFTPNPTPRGGGGAVTLTVNFTPRVRPGQRVSLLLGDHEAQAAPTTANVSNLNFSVPGMTAGMFFVRLRVDGVDSSIIVHGSKPPQFDNAKRVQVT